MSNVQQTDFYQVLGVPRNANSQQIEWAFKKKMAMLDKPALNKKTTPSLTSLQEQIDLVREAYETLSDKKRRLAYHRFLGMDEPQPAVSIPTGPPPSETTETQQPIKDIVNNPHHAATDLKPGPAGAFKNPKARPTGKAKLKKSQSVYLDFFGFTEKPFDLTPDPKYLYLSAKHKEVLAHLVFGLQENNGFLKIVGEVGTGKTTIIRSFLRELREGFNFAYIFHPCVTSLELLQSINEELGLPNQTESKKELIHHLRRFLVKERQLGHRVVVIIDEAQNLEPGVLEELRLLSNLETETEKLIQIVLIGQPELEELLAREELRQLRQRITIQWQLLPLSLDETRGYIQHRLNVAGGKGKIRFDRSAVDLLFRYTQGIPRMINVMADRSLLIAYTKNTRRITPKIIREAARDIGGLTPVSNLKAAAWKVLLPSILLAAMLYVGLDSNIQIGLPRDNAPIVDFKQLIAEDPIDLSDPGNLIPAAPKATVESPVAQPETIKEPAHNPATQGSNAEPETKVPDNAASVPPVHDGMITFSNTGQVKTYLSTFTLEDSQTEAVKAVLQRWGVLPQTLTTFTSDHLARLQSDFGLTAFETNGSFRKLGTLNHPALLEITLPNGQGTKYLAMLSMEHGVGIFGGTDKLRIPLSVIEPLWTHRALVLWRDFESLPADMKNGFSGREAIWLQKNLRLLGFFKGREAPKYGPKTVAAVRAFQRRYGLKDDGRFDTETRILLYNLLSIYETPKLKTSG